MYYVLMYYYYFFFEDVLLLLTQEKDFQETKRSLRFPKKPKQARIMFERRSSERETEVISFFFFYRFVPANLR